MVAPEPTGGAASDIPDVIEAARVRGLFNIGGQLQFRFPNGPTCECYWIDVDTYKELPEDLANWSERVEHSAEASLRHFESLLSTCDFIEEGRKAFPQVFSEFEADGGDVASAMCFVWYVEAERTKSMPLSEG